MRGWEERGQFREGKTGESKNESNVVEVRLDSRRYSGRTGREKSVDNRDGIRQFVRGRGNFRRIDRGDTVTNKHRRAVDRTNWDYSNRGPAADTNAVTRIVDNGDRVRARARPLLSRVTLQRDLFT